MSNEYIPTNKDTRCENVDNHAIKRIRENDSHLLELPLPLIYDILSRLPLKTLFSCLCVCKTFSKFHTDHYFSEVHLSKPKNIDCCLIIQDRINASNIFLINMIDFERLYNWNNGHLAWNSRLWKKLTLPTNIFKPDFVLMAMLVGSCNGLLCVSYQLAQYLNILCVCNPILDEFMVLPQPCPSIIYSAFGYCPKSKKYKVIRFISTSFCEIHTVGTDYWNKIYEIPHPSTPIIIDSSSLNGNIPWITENLDVSKMICSFDLETEQYVYISPPPHFLTTDIRNRMSFIQVGLLGGLFCVSYILDNFQFEVCVMKNYGVESSWIKYITFYMGMKYRFLSRAMSNPYLRLTYEGLHAVTLLNNKDILFSYANGVLVYYSPRKAGVTDVIGLTWERKYEDNMTIGVYDAIEIIPSFISLKNIGEVGSVEVGKLHNFSPDKAK